MRALTLAALALLASVSACTITTTDSGSSTGSSGNGSSSSSNGLTGGIPTNEMHPSFSAQDYGDGSGVHVYAAWLDDKGNWLTTSGGDVVTASDNQGPATTLFLESDEPGKVHYTTNFPSGGPSVAHEIAIALNRPGGLASAPNSTAILGPNFSITTAPPGFMKQGTKALIEISPAPLPDVVGDGDSWQLTASGDCIEDYLASTVDAWGTNANTGLIDDQNRFVFDTSRLVQKGTSTSCGINVMVKHMHYSQLDPSYGSSTSDLSLIYADAPLKNGEIDTSYAIEGIQARAFNTTFSFE